MEEKLNKIKITSEKVGTFIGKVISWLISAGFLYLAWGIIAPHLNFPELTYWEVFIIRMGIGSFIAMFKN